MPSPDALDVGRGAGRTGRRLAWALWPALVIYAALVAWRAHGELGSDDPVVGMFRTWRPPQTLAIGELFDPRAGTLIGEISARYQTHGPHPSDDSVTAWEGALRAHGFHTTRAAGPGEGDSRIVFTPSGPWLIVGRAHGRFVAFDPHRGMLLLHEGVLSPQVPALQLERRPR